MSSSELQQSLWSVVPFPTNAAIFRLVLNDADQANTGSNSCTVTKYEIVPDCLQKEFGHSQRVIKTILCNGSVQSNSIKNAQCYIHEVRVKINIINMIKF